MDKKSKMPAQVNKPAESVKVAKSLEEKPKGEVGKKILKVLFVLGSVILIVLSTFYAVLAYIGADKSLPGLRFYGYDIGGKSYSQIRSIVQSVNSSKSNENVKVVIGNQKEQETVEKKFSDLGLKMDVDGTSKKIYYFGKAKDFPSPAYITSFITGKSRVSPIIKWDPESDKKISDAFSGKNIDPEDAKLKLDGDQIVVEPEKQGAKVNLKKLRSDLETVFYSKEKLQIIAQIVYQPSKIKQSDIEPYLKSIEDFIGKNVTAQYSYKKFKLTKDDLLSFVDLENTLKNKTLAINDGAIDDYLNNTVAPKVNTKGKTRKVSTYDGSVIAEGREGWQINLKDSHDAIKEALSQDKKVVTLSVEVAPIEEEKVEPGFTPGKYPGKYIELNLSEQMLYQWEGANMVGSHRISTGKWSMPTPVGDFVINNKDPRAYSQTYNLYMPWWMSFIGSQYGIHELPEWPDGTKEGEGHLGTPVSHGCVRLGVGDAAAVYDWAEIGTPVYVHT